MVPSPSVEVVCGVALGKVFTCGSRGHCRGCPVCKTEGQKFIVIKLLYFSTVSISSVVGGVQASECFYNNITIFNLRMWLLFAIVDVILNRVAYSSTKVTYYFLDI